jgi:hypothetical protein
MSEADHPDYAGYISCGCADVSASLGIQKMPDGYSLMLDADRMYFFWFERATGRESAIHWNKWAVYRGARADFQRESS